MSNELKLDIPAGVPWIDFTRDFDAPVEAVFNAHRDPELVKQWLGPRGYVMEVDRWDFRSGGGFSSGSTDITLTRRNRKRSVSNSSKAGT